MNSNDLEGYEQRYTFENRRGRIYAWIMEVALAIIRPLSVDPLLFSFPNCDSGLSKSNCFSVRLFLWPMPQNP